MPYATEEDIRLRFQLDEAAAPSSLVTACIQDVHDQVLRLLDPRHDGAPPAGPLILGETLLAGAAVFRALAAREAVEQQRLTLGGARIEEGDRFRSLLEVASASAGLAWFYLEPYLLAQPVLCPGGATDAQPILGQD